jgi:hypothetical protein
MTHLLGGEGLGVNTVKMTRKLLPAASSTKIRGRDGATHIVCHVIFITESASYCNRVFVILAGSLKRSSFSLRFVPFTTQIHPHVM